MHADPDGPCAHMHACTQVEYASGGQLADQCDGQQMSEEDARALFAQLVDGLAYCHSKGVYHRDLRTELLLLSGRCNWLLAPTP